jgi:hypothetical protein
VLLETYHADYRRTSDFDPGTVRIFLRNTGSGTARFKTILLDDIAIPVWGLTNILTASVAGAESLPAADLLPGEASRSASATAYATNSPYLRAREEFSHKRIIWAVLRPPELPSGAISEFAVKFQNPPTRPVKLSFLTASGLRHDVVVRPLPRPLVITAVTFPTTLDRLYAFVANDGPSTTEVVRCELDGQPLERGLWCSSRSIAPGAKEVISVTPPARFRQGDYHTLRLVSRDGWTTAERVRIFSYYPLASESPNTSEAKFGLDAWPIDTSHFGDDLSLPDADAMPTNRVSTAGHRIYNIFNCVMHTYRADHTRTAQQVFHNHDACLLADPGHPTLIHPCRIRPEEGYAKFGETADSMRSNPFVPGSNVSRHAPATPEESAARLAGLAVLGVAPGPWYALVATDDTRPRIAAESPAVLRRLGYTVVAAGARGLFFRHGNWEDPAATELNDAMRRFIAEVDLMRPWLLTADTAPLVAVPAGNTATNELAVVSLVSPDHGIVLILVNRAAALPPGAPARINVALPSWLKPVRLQRVEYDGPKELPLPSATGSVLSLALPVPADAKAYLIECQRKKP